MLDGAHHPSDRAPPPVPGVLTHYRPSMSVFAHTAEEHPAAGEAGDVEDDVSSFWAPPNSHCCPTPRPLHLREQMVCSGLRKRDRHPPVWKSQSRTMLGGCTWAEASSVSFPSRARAETWRRIIKRESIWPVGSPLPTRAQEVCTLSVWPRKNLCCLVSTCRTTMTAWQG